MNAQENHTDYWHEMIEMAKRGLDCLTDWQVVDQLLRDADLISDNQSELKFYQALTLLSKIDRVAKQPATYEHIVDNPPPDELLIPASKKSAELMIEAITYKDWDLLEEALRIIKSQEKRIHPWALPALLTGCKTKSALFTLLKSTTGNRCSWLASHQTQWHWWLRLEDTSWEDIPAEELLTWIIWKRIKGQIDIAAVDALTDRERKRLLEELTTNTLPIDELIGRKFIQSKSINEQGQGMSILLRLPTPERKQAATTVESYCRSTLGNQRNILTFDDKAYPAALPPAYLHVLSTFNSDQPIWGLAGFFSPETILGHLSLPINDLFRQIIENNNLEKLCLVIVQSCASPDARDIDQQALILAWLDHYPSGNSRRAPFEIVISKLSYQSMQMVIKHLLKDPSEYFVEKLLIVCANTDQYIGKELSISLVEKIFMLISLSLNRTEVTQLSEALQHLQYLMDPRSKQAIATHWIEVDYRHKKLAESMREFRETIRRRSILLASILQ